MKLSKQEKKVYDYILANPGCTSHDITIHTFVQKPCARVVGLENKGIVIERRGEIKYGDSRPFKKLYAEPKKVCAPIDTSGPRTSIRLSE